ncbi:MAG TPA: 50S ribosomal protein L21 [Terriglobales bacterium]|nr:50S ribosomal protein L21 [Terriglobales bacterium]
MYAVIRAGGKQYRVAPGDVIKVEKLASADNGNVEFSDVLAVSTDQGKIGGATGETRVVGQVVDEGRGDKILVFHYKRKKQYKKLQGHRQEFTAVRITRISVDGQNFDAPEVVVKAKPAAKPKAAADAATTEEAAKPKRSAAKKSTKASDSTKAAATKTKASSKAKAPKK